MQAGHRQGKANRRNRLLVQEARMALDQMKWEIAREFGVILGPDTTSRANGSVGGEMTKRLVHYAQQQWMGSSAPPLKI